MAGSDYPPIGDANTAAEQDDFETLPRDRIAVRSLREDDLAAMVKIAAKVTGQDQTAYLTRKLADALNESGVRVSLVAELDEHVVGYVMARVDFGDFGKTEPEAVIDTLGVDPDYGNQEVGTALLSQLLVNLQSLRIEHVRTEIRWNQFDLLSFLEHNGFMPSQVLALSRRLV
ncbi:MAG: GNAT family N-acetyltransferase [Sphingomonadales bacterium]